MISDDPFADISALLKVGRKEVHARKAKAPTKPSPEESESKLFSNPENWTRGRGIALIHAETQTLLGNFTEYLHIKRLGARKLIREEGPVLVSAVEEVSGSWWLGEERRPEPVQQWHEQRRCILHTYLGELGLHAPAVPLVVHLSYGSIARVELAEETIFAQTEGEEQLVTLPKGTDVLSCMARDCKVKLRMEIGL